jgi:hypothetical protein
VGIVEWRSRLPFRVQRRCRPDHGCSGSREAKDFSSSSLDTDHGSRAGEGESRPSDRDVCALARVVVSPSHRRGPTPTTEGEVIAALPSLRPLAARVASSMNDFLAFDEILRYHELKSTNG